MSPHLHRSRRHDLVREIKRLRQAALVGYALLIVVVLAELARFSVVLQCLLLGAGGVLMLVVVALAAGYLLAKTVNFFRAEAGRAELERAMWLSHRSCYEDRLQDKVRQIRN